MFSSNGSLRNMEAHKIHLVPAPDLCKPLFSLNSWGILGSPRRFLTKNRWIALTYLDRPLGQAPQVELDRPTLLKGSVHIAKQALDYNSQGRLEHGSPVQTWRHNVVNRQNVEGGRVRSSGINTGTLKKHRFIKSISV